MCRMGMRGLEKLVYVRGRSLIVAICEGRWLLDHPD